MTAAVEITTVVLDVEGTTTPIEFVYEVLFPFARAHAQGYLEANFRSPELGRILDELYEEYRTDVAQKLGPPLWPTVESLHSIAAYVQWLMERDRKSTSLKWLQGRIWEQGYRAGALKGVVFDDVPVALERWSRLDRSVAIFSSGSVLAQKLLFAHSTAGDLTRFISAYFDTTLGPKTEAESYRRLADAIGKPAGSIVFVSDATTELAMARLASMRTVLSLRPGNRPQPDSCSYPQIRSLLEITD